MEKNLNKKVDEKDFVWLIGIVVVLVLVYFLYVNFFPKSFDNSMKIDIIEIRADCDDCVDVSLLGSKFAEIGVEIGEHDVFDYDSVEGKKAMEKYGIERVPSFVVISDAVGEMGIDGAFDLYDSYAVFGMNVPYVDVDSGEVEGVVEIIEIQTDCENCLPLISLKSQFEKMGVRVGNYEIVEGGSERGRGLIDDYDLEFSPSLLISKEIDEYDWVLSGVAGVLEDKGDYYLFNEPIAPYENLSTGSVEGEVEIILLNDSSCEDCFNVEELKGSFQSVGVFFVDEKVLDVSDFGGRTLAKKYNITKVPTVILSDDILDYSQLSDVLGGVGTFEEDGSFVFRNLEAVGKFKEVAL